jgi:hypothetical protein
MGKVARGGGSGQGRSPALAGGGKGKGRPVSTRSSRPSLARPSTARRPRRRAPPSGGASGEASGRPRPPPRPAVGGSPDGPSAAGKRKSHEMTADDVETVRQVGLLMTPSNTESEDDSAPPPSAPPPPGDSGQWTSTLARLKKQKLLCQQANRALAQRMDAAAEESAAERGLLIPSLLAQLISDNVKGKPPLKIGREFTCKAELMLNVAAFNELHHRRFTARNGSKNEGGGGGGIWCRNSPFAYVASCGGRLSLSYTGKTRLCRGK